jgi:transposase
MRPFKREKVLNGKPYIYEITPYYDPKTKTTRHRSKYLGKMINGKLTKVRQKLPRNSYDFGEFAMFQKISDELKFDEILDEILPDGKAKTVKTLVLNRLIDPQSIANIQSWYERTILSKKYGDLPLSSQALSEFLEILGDSAIPDNFSTEFLKRIGKGAPLLYDITSLSSTSKFIELLEWGYNRDDLSLPQMNLSIIAHKDLGIPLAFDVYPGSITDVTTLKNTITKIDSFGLENPLMIMDRGFFSETNLNDLIDGKFNFIMPVPLSLGDVKSLISNSHRDLENPKYLRKYEKEIQFVKPIELTIGKNTLKGFMFYSLKKEQEEKSLFYDRLHSTVEKLERRFLRSYEEPTKAFLEIAKDLSDYFSWTVIDGRFRISIKGKAVSRRLNRAGKVVILYNGDYTWEEVLGWNRERDVIEKMFSDIKNILETLPLRAHKSEVARGLIFITFLALILRTRLLAKMKKTGITKYYSMPALLLELSKIQRVELSDGSMYTTEITKRQRYILERLDVKLDESYA